MEQKLAILYNELANKIVSMIPVEWEDINYLGEVEQGRYSVSSVFYYKEKNGQEYFKSHNIPMKYNVSQEIYNKLLNELNDILLKIYDCYLENGQSAWEQLIMSFGFEGKFNVEYKYDVMNSSDNSQAQREIIWAYESFGYMPKEGTFLWKKLNQYIESKNN